MKLKSIQLRDFKRFSELTISDIPETAKLVILTGPNGSGKTSIFEAFNFWMGFQRNVASHAFDSDYHSRLNSSGPSSARTTLKKMELTFYGVPVNETETDRKRKIFYIRSAYRHEPDFSIESLGSVDDVLNDTKRAKRLSDAEQRVSENYHRLVAEAVNALFSADPLSKEKTVAALANEIVGEIRTAMLQLFDNLELEGPGRPLNGGTFRFKKGTSSGFHYKNLSGGEKAAFDLLLDFIIKRRAFDDTIFCIDEPELHMHTKLQARLLEVMFSLVPDNCQLWLSTHSIGMARTAAQLNTANPGQVAFIDFHNQEFDHPTTLKPTVPDRNFWRQMFHTALDDLATLVVPRYVVFCEGKKAGQPGKNPSFDAEVYRKIFGLHYPEVEFVSLGGGNEVQTDGTAFGYLLTKLAPGIQTWKVLDRDDRNAAEVAALEKQQTFVLSRRDIESFLWDDEVLKKLCAQHNKAEAIEEIKQEKQTQLATLSDRGKPADDIKAIADALYLKCKASLNLTSCGNSSQAFALENLASLIHPNMAIYDELAQTVLAPIKKQP
jgi:predicted ATP-dependent endonuclease of OLD family